MQKRGKRKYKIIRPTGLRVQPSPEELSAADLLLEFFGADIEIIPRGILKSADFLIEGRTWELKSPTGGGKRNIQHQFERGMTQSKRIIIDGRYSKKTTTQLVKELERQAKMSKTLKGLLLITKNKKVVAFIL